MSFVEPYHRRLFAMNLCFAFLLEEIYWPIKIIQRFVMERGEGRPSKQKYSDGSGTRRLFLGFECDEMGFERAS